MKLKLKSIIVFFSYFIFSYFEVVPLYILGIDYEHLSQSIKILYLISINTLFLLSIIYIYRHDFAKYVKDFKINGRKYIDQTIKYWYIGLGIMIAANGIINIFNPNGIAENEAAVRELIAKAPLFMIFSTSIYAPIIEEIVCRKTIKDLISNKWAFVLISGLLFGAAHILIGITSLWSLLYVIPYGALGSAFALAFYKTNNLITPISLHCIHNSILMLLYLILL